MRNLLILLLCLAAFCRNIGAENLIRNPGFEEAGDTPGLAAGWTRQVLMPTAEARLETVNDPLSGSTVLATWFLSPDRAEGARFFQFIELKPRRVYKLSYDYHSDWDGRLSGDVMLTGTGSGIYYIVTCPANTGWTRVVHYVPVLNAETVKAGVYVQNRSQVPLWYDNITLEETDLPLEELIAGQFRLTLHPLTEKDIMLMPDSEVDANFIVQVLMPEFIDRQGMELETRVVHGADIARAALYPLELDAIRSRRIAIPSRLIPEGESLIQVILRDARGTVYAHESVAIERFSREDMNIAVDLENAPVMQRGDEPFFPIAWYGVPFTYDQDSERFYWGEGFHTDIKPYAFNVVQNYLFGGEARPGLKPDLAAQLAFLDGAQAEGMMAMVEIPRTLAEYDREADLAEWLRAIDPHPATLYFRSEEMMHFRKTPLKYLAAASRAVKEVNPARPYYLFDQLNEETASYIDGYDGGMENRFLAMKTRRLLGSDKPILATVNVEWPGRNSPDMAEQRYHTFVPVIHGARGISFFMWSIARFQATDGDYIHRVGRSVDELAEVVPALIRPTPLPGWYPEITVEGAISILRASDGANHWLLAAPSFPDSSGAISFTLPAEIVPACHFGTPEPLKEGGKYTFAIPARRLTAVTFQAER